jgi:hypothetical protein
MPPKRKDFDAIADMQNMGDEEENGLMVATAVNLGVNIPESGRMVATPTPIDDIEPDVRQPRKVLPLAVRRVGGAMSAMLAHWHALAEEQLGYKLDVFELLSGKGEGEIGEDLPQLARDYLDILHLAASIRKDGLINPITVVAKGARYVVETGERRFWCYRILNEYAHPKDYKKIPAIVKRAADVNPWAQAGENGARRALSATERARQIALLIMDMYRGDRGVKFDAYEDLVLPGEPDLPYYAQVANGAIYGIKPGMAQRILDVTDLKSAAQIRQHRMLLRIDKDLWQRADEENWTEGAIRNYLLSTRPAAPESVTTVTLSPHENAESTFVDVNRGGGEIERVWISGPETPMQNDSGGRGKAYQQWADDERHELSGMTGVKSQLGLPNDVRPVAGRAAPMPNEAAVADHPEFTMAAWLLDFLYEHGETGEFTDMLLELRTIKPSDIDKMVNMSDRSATFWEALMKARWESISTAMKSVMIETEAFVNHLITLGRKAKGD